MLAPRVPEEVLQLYFQGLRACALSRTFPEAWKRVFYVLLVKPKKDRRLVQERRDYRTDGSRDEGIGTDDAVVRLPRHGDAVGGGATRVDKGGRRV